MHSDIDLVKKSWVFLFELGKISYCQLYGGCSCPRTWSDLRVMEQTSNINNISNNSNEKEREE